uniref:Uncharacterized protein LOC111123474 n=1 Tax=Crassostrea virginica TaxID=6565 RepID=A0A8B8D150_CRAVI|nr:uncharacterized protein LOC111123474 [Crassostrea virginica]
MEADDQEDTSYGGTKGDRDNSDFTQLESRSKDKAKVSTPHSEYLHKGEGYDPADPGLRPSLLEEVLAQKKLELMRSPEVMRFLQTQQAQKAEKSKTTQPKE